MADPQREQPWAGKGYAMKTTIKELNECLALAEWYATCPRFARKRLGADFSMWAHLFIWAGMLD